MTGILVAGVAVLDFIFQMDAFPTEPEKYRADDATISGGGNAANSAVAIARLGGAPYLAARLGEDQIADLILTGLQTENVNIELVRRYPNCRSSFSSIYLDGNGERQIMNYRDTNLPGNASFIASSRPGQFQAALADTRWPEGALAAMELARSLNIPGVLDAEAPVADAQDALMIASHIAFSAQGAVDFTGEPDVERAAISASRSLPGTVIVTDGDNGVVCVSDGEPRWHAAFSIEPIDTLGAGDVWHGAFALALARGQSQDAAIVFASAAAAIKCTHPGGRDGAPNQLEVARFMEENL